ncbi:hypothetical protein DRE_04177 [Drechslerella stenobrocha 248]|uniref:Uncharacterized protein n=1 Tax=Drechslerella stenobrocha 248 TaxID=1043628 RepID=W7IC68_9PEZI|nr:hypothetical protein DRE_04177 [Drechslerella stenobrocha 248]
MAASCFTKQSLLGSALGRLVEIHPPVELYPELEGNKIKKVGIMGKHEFRAQYGRDDVGKTMRKINKAIDRRPRPAAERLAGTYDYNNLEASDDESDGDMPGWRQLHPPLRGVNAVPHSLHPLYGHDGFLPMDAKGCWVPSRLPPPRDPRTLLDKEDPLYSILLKAANELIDKAGAKEATVIPPVTAASGDPADKVETSKRTLIFKDPRQLPNFTHAKWPTLKKSLGLKRWHIVPVACTVNDELRWWLAIVDMQVQKRSGVEEKASGKENLPHRAVWIFDPCESKAPRPDGTPSLEETFLGKVPEYIVNLLNFELRSLNHHTTPVDFPLTSDHVGLNQLGSGTLDAESYDHPGKFRHFVATFINGHRYNYNNRNPQTGVEVLHAIARMIRIIELDDARLRPAWRQILNRENICSLVPATITPPVTESQRELDLGDDSNSLQNRVRTETMAEIRRYFNTPHLVGSCHSTPRAHMRALEKAFPVNTRKYRQS